MSVGIIMFSDLYPASFDITWFAKATKHTKKFCFSHFLVFHFLVNAMGGGG